MYVDDYVGKGNQAEKTKLQSQKYYDYYTIFMLACEKIEWLLKHKAPINTSRWYETRWSCNVNTSTMYCIFYNVAIIWCLTESLILYGNRKIGSSSGKMGWKTLQYCERWTICMFFVDDKSGSLYQAITEKVRNNMNWEMWNKLSSGLIVPLIFSLIPSPGILRR